MNETEILTAEISKNEEGINFITIRSALRPTVIRDQKHFSINIRDTVHDPTHLPG